MLLVLLLVELLAMLGVTETAAAAAAAAAANAAKEVEGDEAPPIGLVAEVPAAVVGAVVVVATTGFLDFLKCFFLGELSDTSELLASSLSRYLSLSLSCKLSAASRSYDVRQSAIVTSNKKK